MERKQEMVFKIQFTRNAQEPRLSFPYQSKTMDVPSDKKPTLTKYASTMFVDFNFADFFLTQ